MGIHRVQIKGDNVITARSQGTGNLVVIILLLIRVPLLVSYYLSLSLLAGVQEQCNSLVY